MTVTFRDSPSNFSNTSTFVSPVTLLHIIRKHLLVNYLDFKSLGSKTPKPNNFPGELMQHFTVV